MPIFYEKYKLEQNSETNNRQEEENSITVLWDSFTDLKEDWAIDWYCFVGLGQNYNCDK